MMFDVRIALTAFLAEKDILRMGSKKNWFCMVRTFLQSCFNERSRCSAWIFTEWIYELNPKSSGSVPFKFRTCPWSERWPRTLTATASLPAVHGQAFHPSHPDWLFHIFRPPTNYLMERRWSRMSLHGSSPSYTDGGELKPLTLR